MAANWKRIIAREWLYLLKALLVGFIVSVSFGILEPRMSVEAALFFFLSPYVILQIVRFTKWAIKTAED